MGAVLRWIGNILILVFIYLSSFFRSRDSNNYQAIAEDPNSMILEMLSAEDPHESPEGPANKDNLPAKEIAKELGAILFAQKNIPTMVAAGTLSIFGTGLNLFTPYLFGETINLLSSQEQTTTIGGLELSRTALIATLISAYTLSQIIPNLRDQIMAPVTTQNTGDFLLRLNKHLLNKSLQYQAITAQSEQVVLMQKGFMLSNVGTPLLTQVGPTAIEVAIACSVLSKQYGIPMGLGLLTFLASYTYYSAISTESIIKAREISLKTGNAAYDQLCNAITQYKIMRDFGKFNQTMKKVKIALDKSMEADKNAIMQSQKVSLGQIALSRIAMLIPSLYIGLNIQSGRYSIQDFTILVIYLNQLATLLPGFGSAVNQLSSSYPDLQFVFKELAKGNEVIDHHPNNKLNIKSGVAPSIEFENVSFSYPLKPGETSSKLIFKNISFQIPAGQRVALISKSGVGKSTLFKLLYGYYTPDSGTIRINGQDISQVSLVDLQRHISLFEQRPELFLGTIRENIIYGAPNPAEITDEIIWEVARKVNLDLFLREFKDQLDTDVGENGRQLSGGQQQRICILRALFKGGPIRLLDEVTASLDGQAAIDAIEGIASTSSGTTSLMITHKLTEVQYVDQIIIIADGVVIAKGTHDKLLQSCELYQKKWSAYTNQDSTENGESNASSRSSSTLSMIEALGGSKSNLSNTVMNSVEPVISIHHRADAPSLESSQSDANSDKEHYSFSAM